MNKLLQFISVVLLFFCAPTLHAQGNRSITVQVKVLDSFSREFLQNARIELFEMDSTTTIRTGNWVTIPSNASCLNKNK